MDEGIPILEPGDLSAEWNYKFSRFEQDETHKFYVRERRKNCTFMQVMDLWLVVPLCYGCALVQSCDGMVRPYIEYRNWHSGILDYAGLAVLRKTKRQLRENLDFAYICKGCGTRLRPWNGDEMSVSHLHVEEHFRIPLQTPGRRNPSTSVKDGVQKLYGNKCFACSARATAEVELHIDHIIPQSKGGTSAFRNLQPLCERCGNQKSDRLPEEMEVYSTIFFGPYPSESHEGLFW